MIFHAAYRHGYSGASSLPGAEDRPLLSRAALRLNQKRTDHQLRNPALTVCEFYQTTKKK